MPHPWYAKNQMRGRFKRTEYRCKEQGVEFSIDYEEWQSLWKQAVGGPCPLCPDVILTDHNASPDRIDPNKGYVPDNVWFISWKANAAKCNITPDMTRRLAAELDRRGIV